MLSIENERAKNFNISSVVDNFANRKDRKRKFFLMFDQILKCSGVDKGAQGALPPKPSDNT